MLKNIYGGTHLPLKRGNHLSGKKRGRISLPTEKIPSLNAEFDEEYVTVINHGLIP